MAPRRVRMAPLSQPRKRARGGMGCKDGTAEPQAQCRCRTPREVRFPLRQTPGYASETLGASAHGGLLDADASRQDTWDAFDPSRGDAAPGRPRCVVRRRWRCRNRTEPNQPTKQKKERKNERTKERNETKRNETAKRKRALLAEPT